MGGGTGVKSPRHNMLRFCGIAHAKKCLAGMIENAGDSKREVWLKDMMKPVRGSR